VASGQTLAAYCDALAAQCPQHSVNTTNCQIAMSQVPLGGGGMTSDGDTNSINCRWKYLQDPLFNNTVNACQYAGPSGGGRCGVVLSNVCDIMTNVCSGSATTPSYPDSPSCQASSTATIPGLLGLQFQWGYTLGSAASSENSLECRVYHAIASLTTGNSIHCSHYAYMSTQCTTKVVTNVQHYCSNLEYNCGNGTSTNAQYATKEQCAATAGGMLNDGDARNDNAANSLGCREYHSQAAKSDVSHCEHAGPSGAGVCGNRRDAWGAMLNAAPCSDPTVQMFVGMVGNATADMLVPVGTVTPAMPYSTTFDTSKNTQICRIYHLGVASTGGVALSHCSHGTLSGGDNCGTRIGNLCDLLMGVCGFGTNATIQFPDRATCVTGLTATAANNITLGLTVPQDKSGNSLECRFYHATVAASYLAGGSNAATTGAAENAKYHCSHTIAVSAPGGCGASAVNPTPAPVKSAASPLPVVASVVAVVASVLSL